MGHSSMQMPHSVQTLLSTPALPSLSMLIASAGQASTQVSQPVHLSLLTHAGMTSSFLKNSFISTPMELFSLPPATLLELLPDQLKKSNKFS
jgi:hypothetical protein